MNCYEQFNSSETLSILKLNSLFITHTMRNYNQYKTLNCWTVHNTHTKRNYNQYKTLNCWTVHNTHKEKLWINTKHCSVFITHTQRETIVNTKSLLNCHTNKEYQQYTELLNCSYTHKEKLWISSKQFSVLSLTIVSLCVELFMTQFNSSVFCIDYSFNLCVCYEQFNSLEKLCIDYSFSLLCYEQFNKVQLCQYKVLNCWTVMNSSTKRNYSVNCLSLKL